MVVSSLIMGCNKDDFDLLSMAESKPLYMPEGAMAFTHISDIHGHDCTLDVAIRMNNRADIDFALMTGDNLLDSKQIDKIQKSKKPFLMIPGNHDAYDYTTEFDFRQMVLNKMTKDSLQFDDNIHNYWYRDFEKNGNVLRVIGIDQYQVQTLDFDTLGSHYNIMLSQQQINWFIKVLENSTECDGIIAAIHSGLGNSKISSRDTTNINSFISLYAQHYKYTYDYNGNGDPRLLSDIVGAYMSGVNIEGKEYESGCPNYKVSVNTHFNKPNDNFIAFLGGHLHWDVVEKIPNSDILQVLIAYGGYGKGSLRYDDLIKCTNGIDSYVINANIIDFKNSILKIVRCGANITDYSTSRDSICYNWKIKEFITE